MEKYFNVEQAEKIASYLIALINDELSIVMKGYENIASGGDAETAVMTAGLLSLLIPQEGNIPQDKIQEVKAAMVRKFLQMDGGLLYYTDYHAPRELMEILYSVGLKCNSMTVLPCKSIVRADVNGIRFNRNEVIPYEDLKSL